MNRGLKISLIILGSLAVVGGVTFGIIKFRKNKEEKENKADEEQQNTESLEIINEGLEGQNVVIPNKNYVEPIRNLDKVINNSFSEIKGVRLIPATKSNDPIKGHPFAEGFANIRSSAEVNNKSSWYDVFDNLLGVVRSGNPIGTIISESYDNMTPKMRWFKVKLSKPIDGEQFGFVRGDTVTFYRFAKKKSSGFDGNMIERYNTSYQLGAEVFPHSNWNIGYPMYGNNISSNFEGDLDLDI